jgi:chemotaxis protein methyltransferase CheR
MEDGALTPGQFKQYSAFLYAKTGINLPDHKLYLAEARLAKFVGPGKPFTNHRDFFLALQAAPQGDWMELFINALTTNFSYFFRDPVHFDALAWYARERGPTSSALRFWSAASSTGEEAYSMAITLLRHREVLPADTKILATDISTRVLEVAAGARYPDEAIAKSVPPAEVSRWFTNVEGEWEVKPEVRSRVAFRHLNLKDPFPIQRPMDIVFLRNVLIYFDKASKEDVVNRIEKVLRPGGLLIVGMSESLVELRHPYRMLRNSLYQKTGA